MLDYFMHMLRESFMYNFRNPELSYMTQDEENFAKNFARFINEANIIDISNLFEDSKRMISQNANAKSFSSIWRSNHRPPAEEVKSEEFK